MFQLRFFAGVQVQVATGREASMNHVKVVSTSLQFEVCFKLSLQVESLSGWQAATTSTTTTTSSTSTSSSATITSAKQ